MAPLCPNLSNKKVKQAFDEMKEIFGEDMAYFLWSENGGYPLDLAPNGASSILFKSLMDHYGDRKQALISKAKVYSSNFKDWFGDWTKVIPKTVFKKGDIISIGDSNFTVSRVEKYSNYNVPIVYVKEPLQIRKGGFSPSLNVIILSEINTDEETIKHELIHSKEYNVDTSSLNNLYEKVKRTITEDSFIDGVVTNNFRKNIHEFIADALTKSTFRNALKKEGILNKVETAINNIIEKIPKDDVSKVVDENGEPLVVYHGTSSAPFNTFDKNRIGSRNSFGINKECFYFTDSKENAKSIAIAMYKDDIIINGEPLFKSDYPFMNSKYISKIVNYKVSDSFADREVAKSPYDINVIKDYYKAIGKEVEITEVQKDTKNIYPSFLNIKEMPIKDYKGQNLMDTSSAEFDNFITNTKDGGKLQNIKDGKFKLANTYFVKNPNQIKSATDNNGKFSKQDDNIYHDIQDEAEYYQDAREYADELEKKYLSINYLNLSKERKEALKRRVREEFSKKFKHYRITFYYPKDNKSKHLKTYVKNNDEHDLTEWGKVLFGEASTDNNYSDDYDSGEVAKMILREVRGTSVHEMLIGELIAKALKQYNIIFAFSKTLDQDVAAKYEVVHGTRIIYINTKAAFINTNNYKNRVTQTIMHEMLHAITEEAISRNDDLYKQIDRLRKQVIKALGNNAKDYGLTSVYEFMAELSNIKFVEKLKNIKTEKKITFFEWIRSIVNEIARRILRFAAQNNGTAYSDAMELLVKSVFPEEYNLPLSEVPNKVVREYNQISANPSSAFNNHNEIQTKLLTQFSKLEKLYEKMPNKSVSRQSIQDKLFETITELKTQNDIDAIETSLKVALTSIGGVNVAQGGATDDFSVLGYLDKQSKLQNPFSGVTPEILMDMYRNSINFYRTMLDTIPESIDKNLTSDIRDYRRILTDSLNSAEILWKQALVAVSDRIADKWIDMDFTNSDEVKKQHRQVIKDYLHYNMMHGDINAVQRTMENAAFSSNPVIKYMHNTLSYANLKIQRESNQAAVNVRRAYKKANTFAKKFGPKWQQKMMEFGKDGLPTGYFVRPINYGQYQLDLNNFIETLNDAFDNMPGIMHHYIFDDVTGSYINSVTGISAEEEEWGPNGEMPDYYRYMLEIEKWKCEHANRRYTFEYYKERMSRPILANPASFIDGENVKGGHGLSPKTLIRYNRVQSKINYYLDKCTDEYGFVRVEELNQKDLQKYDLAKKELENLSNPFNEDGSLKSLEALQMAMEIKSWQNFINKDVDTITAFNEYEAELQKITDPVKRANFIKYNSKYSINPDYLKNMPKQSRQGETYEVVKARYIKSMLQNCVMYDHSTTLERDLGQYENYDVNNQFWQNCKEVDQMISDGSQTDGSFMEEFEKYFKSVPQVYRDKRGIAYHLDGTKATEAEIASYYKENDNIVRANYRLLTWYDYMVNTYIQKAKTERFVNGIYNDDGQLIDFSNKSEDDIKSIITDRFTFYKNVFENGIIITKQVPLSIFSNMYPTQEQYNGRPTVMFSPIGRFREKNSRFFNDEYDKTDHNSEQPKAFDEDGDKLYDNYDAYNEVLKDKGLKSLYDVLINTMQQAQNDYQSKNTVFNYRLPKYEATNTAQLSRVFRNGFKLKDVYQGLHDTVLGTRASDEDMRRGDDYKYDVHNAFDSDVSLRYIGSLENRARYSFDVTAAVLMYLHMAKNYKYKKQVEAELWTIRQALDPENRIGEFNKDENTLKAADNVLNTGLYDSSAMDAKSAKYMNISKVFQGIGSKAILGVNILSMNLGFVDALRALTKDAFVGKYLTPRDLISGIGTFITSLPKLLMNIGQPLANCKLIAMMQRFGLSTKYQDNSKDIGDSKTVKLLKSLLMGGFKLGDYTTSAIALKAFTNNFRFYNGGKVPTGFYTQWGLQQAFKKNGYSEFQANMARMCTMTTLWDAFKFENGEVIIKPEFQPYVTDKIEKQLRSTAINRAGMIQGVNIDEDTPLYKSSIIGSFIAAMRGWMFQRGQELLSGRDDTSEIQFKEVREEYVENGKTKVKIKKVKLPRTKEQELNRAAWDPGRDEPMPEEAKACARAFVQFLKNTSNILSFGTLAKDKKRKFSYSERKACRMFLVEIGMIAALIYGLPFMFNWQSDVDDDDDIYRGDMSMKEVLDNEIISYKHFFTKGIYKKALYNTYLRLTSSALEQETPFCTADVIKSITVFQQNMNAFGYGMSYIMRGLYNEDGTDIVKTGSYDGFTVDQRDLFKATCFLDNLHKSLTNNGLDANNKFYYDSFIKEAFFLKLVNFDLDQLKPQKSSYSRENYSNYYKDPSIVDEAPF